jgi:tetratricopeptide (TPR) repeat protein
MYKPYRNPARNTIAILFVFSLFFSCKNQSAVNFYNEGVAKASERTDLADSAANETARQAKMKAALADFDQAIQIDGNYADAYEKRALVKRALADYNGSIADAEKLAELKPAYPDAYYFIGQTKSYFMKDYAGAARAYGQAINLKPDYARLYFLRANAEKQSNDNNDALADFNKAIALSPAGDSQNKYYYSARGVLKLDMKDKTGCLDLLKAIALGDSSSQALLNDLCK